MKGQTIIEYVIIVGIVVMALYAMGPAFKRGIQSVIRGTADQLAVQENAEQDFSSSASHMDLSTSQSKMNTERNVVERVYEMNTTVKEETDSTTRSVTNMGFVKQ